MHNPPQWLTQDIAVSGQIAPESVHDIKEMGFKKISHIDGGFSAIKKSNFKVV